MPEMKIPHVERAKKRKKRRLYFFPSVAMKNLHKPSLTTERSNFLNVND